MPETDAAIRRDEVRQRSDAAVAALIAGREEFADYGTMTPCAEWLASTTALLYGLGEGDYVALLLGALRKENLTYAHHMVEGKSLEFHGKLAEAAESYRKAAECEPDEVLPLAALGSVRLKSGDAASARPLLEKALESSTDKLPVLHMLLNAYESLKEYGKLAETYEACFALAPNMIGDKQVKKAYRKACKKAGRRPAAR